MDASGSISPDRGGGFPAAGRLSGVFGRRASAGRGLTEAELLRQVRRRHADLDLASYSDRELRDALAWITARAETSGPETSDSETRLAEAFAIGDESIRRRLGAWRIFDPSFDRQDLELYFRLTQSEDQSDGQSAGAGPGPAGLDADGQIIVDTIRYVREVGQGRYGWDILLPAGFYRALARKDPVGRLRFQATDAQILAGLHLFRGKVVELNAGEGKTVAAAFPALLHAALGRRVHVITANDYLAARDCDLLAPVYRSLGLTVDVVLGHFLDEERRHAYGRQIVYGTLREFGFDFLRDNLKMSPAEQVQGALQVALVDEADQALIDEARTPLIISGAPLVNRRAFDRAKKAVEELIARQSELARAYLARLDAPPPGRREQAELLGRALLAQPDDDGLRQWTAAHPRACRRAWSVIYPDGSDCPDPSLTSDLYYLVDPEERFVTLTARGLALLETRLGAFYAAGEKENEGESEAASAFSRKRSLRLNVANQVYQLLRAYLLLKKDVDYVVTGEQVVLIDRCTGRPKPDSRYQEGLHPALEAKESVTVHPDCEALAQVSVQGFARRYSRLAGMTGTAVAAAAEFRRQYGLEVVAISARRPLLRRDLPGRVYATGAERLAAVADAARFCRQTGRPVLVGVQTVEQSAQVSRRLGELGVEHRLLNAVTGPDEAEILRQAGALGAVTVATNMAGRGADIILEPDLNRCIINNFRSLLRRRLERGNSPVFVTCYTAAEADLLAGALAEDGELSFTRRRRDRREELTITSALQASPSTAPATPSEPLEFGLGLYVISAEFNESPRVVRQLQGRSGRQGQFGATRFMLSWDDRLLAYRGRRPVGLAACRRTDAAGRVYFEGKPVERCLRRVQEIAEAEASAQRSVSQDYAAVFDAHADAYYRARCRAMAAGHLFDYCAALTGDTARGMVERRFPGGDAVNYGHRFSRLARELQQWYGVACAGWRGRSLDELPGALAGLLTARLEALHSRLGENRFDQLARLLLLQSGDEMWKDYRAGLQSLTSSSRMGGYGHKSAVADYIIHATDAWKEFRGAAADHFLSRLLTFPLARLEELAPQENVIELDEPAAMLVR